MCFTSYFTHLHLKYTYIILTKIPLKTYKLWSTSCIIIMNFIKITYMVLVTNLWIRYTIFNPSFFFPTKIHTFMLNFSSVLNLTLKLSFNFNRFVRCLCVQNPRKQSSKHFCIMENSVYTALKCLHESLDSDLTET